jgi:hypothetical protein
MADFKTRLNVSISYTDETGLELLSDSVGLGDAVSRHLTKVFADQFPVQDVFLYGWVIPRSLADTVGSTDAISFAVSKALGPDSFTFSDGATWSMGKAASDSMSFADTFVLAPNKGLAETILLSDGFSLLVAPVFGDSYTLGDAVAKQPNLGLSDALPGFTDNVVTTPGTLFSDSIGTFSDSAALSIGLVFGEVLTMQDQYFLDYTNNKTFDEQLGFAVEFTFASTKSLSESISLAETGLLRMQDYAAQDYFAEDYVVATTRFW